MIWDVEKQNSELFNHYKTMILLRKNNKALIYGDYKSIYCKENVLVFERTYKDETLLIAINNNDHDYKVEMNLGDTAIDILTSEKTQLNNGLILGPMQFKIFKL